MAAGPVKGLVLLVLIGLTVSRAGVQPLVDIERAGFTGDGCGHRLVGVVLVLGEEYIQRRGGDDLGRVLGILGKQKQETSQTSVSNVCLQYQFQ